MAVASRRHRRHRRYSDAGLWIWLGMALVLGMEQIGGSGMRMPLILGSVLVGASLLLVGLRLAATTDGYGWQPERNRPPTRALPASG